MNVYRVKINYAQCWKVHLLRLGLHNNSFEVLVLLFYATLFIYSTIFQRDVLVCLYWPIVASYLASYNQTYLHSARMLFIYYPRRKKLPYYLCSLVSYKYSTCNVRSQDILTLAEPHVQFELNWFQL